MHGMSKFYRFSLKSNHYQTTTTYLWIGLNGGHLPVEAANPYELRQRTCCQTHRLYRKLLPIQNPQALPPTTTNDQHIHRTFYSSPADLRVAASELRSLKAYTYLRNDRM
eukprot:scaffold6145_cov74-Cylindrotheca_fusiformis.AAC.2